MPTYARPKNADSIEVDDIRSIAGAATGFSAGIKTNTIAEVTANAGVTIDGALIKDGVIAQSALSLAFSTWVPTYSASGAMTFTSVTTDNAKYIQMGKLVILFLQAFGTTGGTASTSLEFTLPVTAANVHFGGSAWVNDGAKIAGVVTFRDVSILRVQRFDNANFGLGSGRYINVNMMYEAA
jgi:hypothetical protein